MTWVVKFHWTRRFAALLGVMLGLVSSTTYTAESEQALPVMTLYGDSNYFPYSYEVNGEMKGLYTQMLLEIAKLLPAYRLELKPIPWKRGLLLTEQGGILGLYPPYRLEQTRFYMRPYSHALFRESVTIFCAAGTFDTDGPKHWPQDFLGLTVTTNLGFSLLDTDFWNPVEEGKIQRVEHAGNDENIIAVAILKTADCYINDRESINASYTRMQHKIANANLKTKLLPLQEALVVQEQEAVIGYSVNYLQKHPTNLDFVKAFDQAIETFRASPHYDELLASFWANVGQEESPP